MHGLRAGRHDGDQFWLALVLFGVAGISALLTECHTPAERAKTKAANDFVVFVTMAVSSTSSGLLPSKSGWHAVNYGSIPFLLAATSATSWLMWQRRGAARAVPQKWEEQEGAR